MGSGTSAVPLIDPAYGFDFNPVADRIRLVSDRQNLRLNPNDGTVVDGDPATAGIQPDSPLVYAAGDPNVGTTPRVTGAA